MELAEHLTFDNLFYLFQILYLGRILAKLASEIYRGKPIPFFAVRQPGRLYELGARVAPVGSPMPFHLTLAFDREKIWIHSCWQGSLIAYIGALLIYLFGSAPLSFLALAITDLGHWSYKVEVPNIFSKMGLGLGVSPPPGVSVGGVAPLLSGEQMAQFRASLQQELEATGVVLPGTTLGGIASAA